MKQTEDHIILEWFTQDAKQREQAFVALTQKFGNSLYFQIQRIVGDSDDAKDVLQNVFVKVYRSLESFKGDSSLHTWLYRIALNESLNFIASKNRKQATRIDQHFIQIEDESTNLPDVNIIEKVLLEAIESLPEKQAIVFQMRYFDETPFAEISSLTGTSEGALKANYHHARQKVEEYLRKTLNLDQ